MSNLNHEALYDLLIKDLEFLVKSHDNAIKRERDRQEFMGLTNTKWAKYIDGLNALNTRVRWVLDTSKEREKDHAKPVQTELPLD